MCTGLAINVSICSLFGYILTGTPVLLRITSRFQNDVREEAWEEAAGARKRTAAELLFIVVHNAFVAFLAAVAWICMSRTLAFHAFCLEIGYEVFDAVSLGKRLEPETLIHHFVSPICIICSMQTDIDFRVLCHLCFCIEFSGAILGYCKFLLTYTHCSPTLIYRRLTLIYAVLRVALPLIDTAIIVFAAIKARGGLLAMRRFKSGLDEGAFFGPNDWTQLYFWAMAMLDAFNLYFFLVIRARARLPAHVLPAVEGRRLTQLSSCA
jgi:hypothetical protein